MDILAKQDCFVNNHYWSAMENENNNAWKQNFDNGNQNNYNFIRAFI